MNPPRSPQNHKSNEPNDAFENELCLYCLQPNIPLVKFCRHCRAPLHPLAAICPYERIYATGFIWRTAVSTPQTPLVIIGIYLYFLPIVIFNAFMLKTFLESNAPSQYSFFSKLTFLTPLFIYGVISFLIILQTTKNYYSATSRNERKIKKRVG